jgi:hypothetical protein
MSGGDGIVAVPLLIGGSFAGVFCLEDRSSAIGMLVVDTPKSITADSLSSPVCIGKSMVADSVAFPVCIGVVPVCIFAK